MRKKLLLFSLLLALLVACTNSPSSKATINGYVVDMKAGEPVVRSTVTILQTGDKTTTDENGFYSIEVPPGQYSIRFEKDGYATSLVQDLMILDPETRYSTIQRPLFDPEVTTSPPTLRAEVQQQHEPRETVTVKVSGSVQQPSKNGFTYLDVAIGQEGGNSGYLNGYVRHQRVFSFDGSEIEISLSTEGYSNIIPIYIVAYDANGNRTEVVRYIHSEDSGELPDPLAPSKLSGEATTFGDVSVFGPLNAPTVSGRKIIAALKAGNLDAIAAMANAVQEACGNVSLQGEELRKAISWVDLYFGYDSEADPPEAFEIFRKRADESNFYLVGRIAAADAQTEEGMYTFRDASPGVQPSVELTYRVDAINGRKRATSETFTLTPLPPFYVTAISPADNSSNVGLRPGYLMSLENSADVNILAAIVTDRIQADGAKVEYLSPVFTVAGSDGEFSPFSGLSGIPHGVIRTDSGYALSGAILQPFHAYDWMPFAVTVSLNEDGEIEASSIAADLFEIWGPFAVKDGPVNTFLTGAGGD